MCLGMRREVKVLRGGAFGNPAVSSCVQHLIIPDTFSSLESLIIRIGFRVLLDNLTLIDLR